MTLEEILVKIDNPSGAFPLSIDEVLKELQIYIYPLKLGDNFYSNTIQMCRYSNL